MDQNGQTDRPGTATTEVRQVIRPYCLEAQGGRSFSEDDETHAKHNTSRPSGHDAQDAQDDQEGHTGDDYATDTNESSGVDRHFSQYFHVQGHQHWPEDDDADDHYYDYDDDDDDDDDNDDAGHSLSYYGYADYDFSKLSRLVDENDRNSTPNGSSSSSSSRPGHDYDHDEDSSDDNDGSADYREAPEDDFTRPWQCPRPQC